MVLQAAPGGPRRLPAKLDMITVTPMNTPITPSRFSALD